MVMTPQEIKTAIANGEITAITVDTNIFDEAGPGFGALQRATQFHGTAVKFVLSEIVIREVEAHFVTEAEDALAVLRKALKTVGRSWDISRNEREKRLEEITGNESANQLASRRLKEFLKFTAAVSISHKDVDLSSVVNDYFANNVPFGNGEKKAEFPDAIALKALEQWAEAQKTSILVVSKDGDWKRYCAESNRLVLVEDFGDALSYFHAEYEGLAADVAARMDSGAIDWDERVKAQVASSLEAIGIVADAPAAAHYYEADVWDVEVLSVALERSRSHGAINLKPIERGEDYLVVQVRAKVKIGVRATFAFSTSDSEGDHIPLGSADAYQEDVIETDLILTVIQPASHAEIDDVEVEIGKQALWIEFDSVEGPDWGED